MKWLIFLAVSFLFLKNAECNDKLKNMETEKVVPDVIDKLPKEALKVIYNNKEINFGNELTPTEVKDQPKVIWNADKGSYYTLALIDPDAPSRADPKFRYVNHWLVTNIQGNDLTTADVIAEYLGSGPPKGTDLHRYVFLLFKQSKKLNFDEPKTSALSRAHRLNFDIKNFVKKYNLGDPIAGNFYKAKWDNYVDVRRKIQMVEVDELVPDVIDVVPPKTIDVTYGNYKVDSGNELLPNQLENQPKVSWEADKNVYYTLSMIDPDAPSRANPKMREVNHWLVTNILGNDIKSGDVIAAYIGTGPPKDTDLHRYLFVVYKQPKKISFDEPKIADDLLTGRLNFSIRKFAKKYSLGKPIAANYFKAKWEPFVEEFMKRFKDFGKVAPEIKKNL